MFFRFISLGGWVSHLVFSKAPLFEKSSSLGTWCVDVEAYGFLHSWIRSVDRDNECAPPCYTHTFCRGSVCTATPANYSCPVWSTFTYCSFTSQKKSGKLRRNKVRKGTFRILADFSLMGYLKKRKNGTLTVFIHLYKHK